MLRVTVVPTIGPRYEHRVDAWEAVDFCAFTALVIIDVDQRRFTYLSRGVAWYVIEPLDETLAPFPPEAQ